MVFTNLSERANVGLQHAVPPTNIKIQAVTSPNSSRYYPTNTHTSTEHHISSLHSHFWVRKSISADREKKKGEILAISSSY